MLIFNEDKYNTVSQSNVSHQTTLQPFKEKDNKLKQTKTKNKPIKKKLTKINSEFLKTLGFTVKRK